MSFLYGSVLSHDYNQGPLGTYRTIRQTGGPTPGAPRAVGHVRARLRTPRLAGSAACRAALIGPGEDELPVARGGADAIARDELALQDLLRERILDLLLDGALERPRPVHRIEAGLADQVARAVLEHQVHVALLQPP